MTVDTGNVSKQKAPDPSVCYPEKIIFPPLFLAKRGGERVETLSGLKV